MKRLPEFNHTVWDVPLGRVVPNGAGGFLIPTELVDRIEEMLDPLAPVRRALARQGFTVFPATGLCRRERRARRRRRVHRDSGYSVHRVANTIADWAELS